MRRDEEPVKRRKKGSRGNAVASPNSAVSQEDAAATSSSAAAELITSFEASSVSSPLRMPFIPEVKNLAGKVVYDPAIDDAYFEEEKKYSAKLGM